MSNVYQKNRISEILGDVLPLAGDLEARECRDIIEFEQVLKVEAKTQPTANTQSNGGGASSSQGNQSGAPTLEIDGDADDGGDKPTALSRKNSKRRSRSRNRSRRNSRASASSGSETEGSEDDSYGSMSSNSEAEDEDDKKGQEGGEAASSLDASSLANRKKREQQMNSEEYARVQKYVSRPLHERLDMLIRVIGGKLGMLHQGQLVVNRVVLKFVPRYIADPKTLQIQQ
jgi:hypothetical protein